MHGHRLQYVRRSVGEALNNFHIQQAPKHPLEKMFWGCFTFNGTGRLCSIEVKMNSVKYQEILAIKLVPSMQKSFPDESGIFQQDNEPCHTSKKMQNFFKKAKLTGLDWPGNSPDLNPIENLWAIIKKKRFKNCDCFSKTKLIKSIIQIWYNDDEVQNICSTLVDSMPTQILMIINAKGGHTKY